jgi:hypothetical protein
MHIFPDTWINISQVIQNSIDQLIEKQINETLKIESIKEYSIRWNEKICYQFLEILEKGNQFENKMTLAQEKLE